MKSGIALMTDWMLNSIPMSEKDIGAIEACPPQAFYFASDITSDMISEWLSRVGSAIPRGFSRQYILALLREQPMTGKEIIDKATVESGGRWKPSPGLIYPLLGRLLDEGLVTEGKDGRYNITKKGMEITSDLESFGSVIQKQIDVVLRVGSVGKFMAMDLIDRIAAIGSALSSNLDSMTQQERDKYREFLQSELKKLDDQKAENNAAEKEHVDVQ
jgi:DNA-binding PadR family transcriptional regulator